MKTNLPGTTQAEADTLAATAALIAAGKDPFGDDGDDEGGDQAEAKEIEASANEEGDGEPPKVEPGSMDGETAAAKTDEETDDEGDADLTAEALEAVAAADEPEAAPAPAAQRYKAGDPAEFKALRDEQIGIKAKALKDLMDGVIEPEEYSRIESEVADKLDAITVQRTLHEANVQSEAQEYEAALDRIIAASKKAGEIDYKTDAKAAKQFDTAMRMLADDGETRTFAELAAEAHKAVLAIRGIKKAEPAATPAAEPAKPRENGKGPMTLRNVPAAEMANSGGGWKEQLATLNGQEYEAAYAKLSPAQKAELLND
jgi:hypothetical protein